MDSHLTVAADLSALQFLTENRSAEKQAACPSLSVVTLRVEPRASTCFLYVSEAGNASQEAVL